MTHLYHVTGMTCASCETKIRSELLKLPEITAVAVNKDTGELSISMYAHVSLTTLESALAKAGNYQIRESVNSSQDSVLTLAVTRLSVYKPLLMVIGFITGLSIISGFSAGVFNFHLFMRAFMAGFFLVFSFFKFLDLRGFADSYSTYDLLAGKWHFYGFIYPFLELGLGLAYFTGFFPVFTNGATILIMGFSSIGVIRAVMDQRKIQCACLGAVFNLPMSTVTIVEDLLMVLMSVAMLFMFA